MCDYEMETTMDQRNFTGDYDTLLELVKTRVSVRNLKPDPIPDAYVTQILEVGRWAMSGANGQPWDFVVVKDAAIKKELFRVYTEENNDFIYWMEQQRDFKLRHPSFQMTHDQALQKHRTSVGWSIAPVLIVILGFSGGKIHHVHADTEAKMFLRGCSSSA